MRRSSSCAVLLSCLLCITSASAGPRFTVTPTTLRADSTGTWHAEMRIENVGSELGFYADSLVLTYVNADGDRSARPAQGVVDLSALVRMQPPISSGETSSLSYGAPADFERGTLRFRVSGHDSQNHRGAAEFEVQVTGSDLGDAHPPILLEMGAARTDLVFLAADSAKGPTATVLYVPPSGTAARSLMRWTQLLRLRGYNVAIVSLPGWGRSTGAEDAAGPASAAAVTAAVQRLRKLPLVDAARIAVWGEREGANAALLAAAGALPVTGVFALNADLDPWASYRRLSSTAQAAYVTAAGRDSAAWQARSPLAAAARIGVPVMLVQTSDARMDDPAPAEAFAAVRSGKDLYIETRLSPREPKPIRRADVNRLVLGFLERRLGH